MIEINFILTRLFYILFSFFISVWMYVPRRKWNVVDRIIQDSAEIFSSDFLDAK